MQSRFHTTSVKPGHCRNVRRMTALAPKADSICDLAMSRMCHKRTFDGLVKGSCTSSRSPKQRPDGLDEAGSSQIMGPLDVSRSGAVAGAIDDCKSLPVGGLLGSPRLSGSAWSILARKMSAGCTGGYRRQAGSALRSKPRNRTALSAPIALAPAGPKGATRPSCPFFPNNRRKLRRPCGNCPG
jgi:hypothetical protein